MDYQPVGTLGRTFNPMKIKGMLNWLMVLAGLFVVVTACVYWTDYKDGKGDQGPPGPAGHTTVAYATQVYSVPQDTAAFALPSDGVFVITDDGARNITLPRITATSQKKIIVKTSIAPHLDIFTTAEGDEILDVVTSTNHVYVMLFSLNPNAQLGTGHGFVPCRGICRFSRLGVFDRDWNAVIGFAATSTISLTPSGSFTGHVKGGIFVNELLGGVTGTVWAWGPILTAGPAATSVTGMVAFSITEGGAVLTSFTLAGPSSTVVTAAEIDKSRSIIYAAFTPVSGVSTVAAFGMGSGGVDSVFNAAGLNVTGTVYRLALDRNTGNGRLLIGGRFSLVSNVARTHIASVDAVSGALQAGVSLAILPNTAGYGTVFDINADPVSHNIIVVGSFSTVGGVARKNFAALNSDGTLNTFVDAGFTNNVIFDTEVDWPKRIVYTAGSMGYVNYVAATRSGLWTQGVSAIDVNWDSSTGNGTADASFGYSHPNPATYYRRITPYPGSSTMFVSGQNPSQGVFHRLALNPISIEARTDNSIAGLAEGEKIYVRGFPFSMEFVSSGTHWDHGVYL